MPTGAREVDTIFTRVPLMEFDQWPASSLISTGVLDLVDFFPAEHFRIFNPSAAPPIAGSQVLPFPATLGASNGAFVDPRFVVHYFIGAAGITRTNAAGSFVEFNLTTGAFGVFPTTVQTPIAFIPWVGVSATIASLAGGGAQPGECQSGQIVIPGRYLMITARFSATDPGSFQAGFYLAPIPG